MSILFLLITAITVSIDSFFGGLSLSVKTKNKLLSLLGVVLAVFTVCFLGSTFGELFGKLLENYASVFSGFILLLVGIVGVFTCKNEKELGGGASFLSSLVVGFSVGLDGAVGCFSLTSAGYNPYLTCSLITLVHALLMIISFLIADKIPKKIKRCKILPPLILIFLGFYKIIPFFI